MKTRNNATLFILALLSFLLSACAPRISEIVVSPDYKQADTTSDPTLSDAEQGNSNSLKLENFQIDTVSYAESFDWESKRIEGKGYSFSLPSTWQEYPAMVQNAAVTMNFLAPSSADLAKEPSNIVLENNASETFSEVSDLSAPETQETFFSIIFNSLTMTKTHFKNIHYSVWEAAERFIYIVNYDRENSDGEYIAHQTCYYIMGYDQPVIVYATDMGDNMPNLQEIAQQIALSFELS